MDFNLSPLPDHRSFATGQQSKFASIAVLSLGNGDNFVH